FSSIVTLARAGEALFAACNCRRRGTKRAHAETKEAPTQARRASEAGQKKPSLALRACVSTRWRVLKLRLLWAGGIWSAARIAAFLFFFFCERREVRSPLSTKEKEEKYQSSDPRRTPNPGPVRTRNFKTRQRVDNLCLPLSLKPGTLEAALPGWLSFHPVTPSPSPCPPRRVGCRL